MSRFNMPKAEKGFVFVISLLLMTLMGTIIGVSALSNYYRQNIDQMYVNSVKAYYLALSGIEYARSREYRDWSCETKFEILNNANPGKAVSLSLLSTEDVIIKRDPADWFNAEIKSTGKSGNIERTVYCSSGDPSIPESLYLGIYLSSGNPNCYRYSPTDAGWFFLDSLYFQYYESALPIIKWKTQEE